MFGEQLTSLERRIQCAWPVRGKEMSKMKNGMAFSPMLLPGGKSHRGLKTILFFTAAMAALAVLLAASHPAYAQTPTPRPTADAEEAAAEEAAPLTSG
jgi:hypothetical protein